MSKNKQKKYIITSEQMFDFHKPKFNAWQTGSGAHKNKKKYDRKRDKKKVEREWKME